MVCGLFELLYKSHIHEPTPFFNPVMDKKLINCTKVRLKCRLEKSSMYDNTYKISQQAPTYKNVER